MADYRSIAGNDSILFRLEDGFQMACLSWNIDVQNLADGGRSLYCLLVVALLPFSV